MLDTKQKNYYHLLIKVKSGVINNYKLNKNIENKLQINKKQIKVCNYIIN